MAAFWLWDKTRRSHRWPGSGTETIDLRGRTVIPGLFDSHAHLQEVGLKLSLIRLDECRSAEEMMELVRERARSTPPGEWIVGTGWNEGNFLTGQLPTRHDIDPATADHPVILMRFLQHGSGEQLRPPAGERHPAHA